MKKLYYILSAIIISLAYTVSVQAQSMTMYTTSESCFDLSANMKMTSNDMGTNYEVTKLQNFLKANNYLTASSTGYFGTNTMKAVKDFQTLYNLIPSGIVGAVTRAKIKSITCGSTYNASSTNSSSTAYNGGPVIENFKYSVYPADQAGICMIGSGVLSPCNGTAALTWTVRNASTCNITGPNLNLATLDQFKGVNFNISTSSDTYTLTCTGMSSAETIARTVTQTLRTNQAIQNNQNSIKRMNTNCPEGFKNEGRRCKKMNDTTCSYAPAPSSCVYVPGRSYDAASNCGLVLRCGGPAANL